MKQTRRKWMWRHRMMALSLRSLYAECEMGIVTRQLTECTARRRIKISSGRHKDSGHSRAWRRHQFTGNTPGGQPCTEEGGCRKRSTEEGTRATFQGRETFRTRTTREVLRCIEEVRWQGSEADISPLPVSAALAEGERSTKRRGRQDTRIWT